MAEAHLALGDVKLYYEWDWPGAERDLRRALELNPSLAEAHYHNAWYLDLMGRRDEAISELKSAQERDPLSPLFPAWLGAYCMTQGQYDEALEEARKSLDLHPNFPVGHHSLGMVYARMEMYKEAIAAHQRAAAIAPPFRGSLGITYAVAGMPDEAREVVAAIEADGNPADALSLARVYAALGKRMRPSGTWIRPTSIA